MYAGYYQTIDGTSLRVSEDLIALKGQWCFSMHIFNLGSITEEDLKKEFQTKYPEPPEQGTLFNFLNERYPIEYEQGNLIHKVESKTDEKG